MTEEIFDLEIQGENFRQEAIFREQQAEFFGDEVGTILDFAESAAEYGFTTADEIRDYGARLEADIVAQGKRSAKGIRKSGDLGILGEVVGGISNVSTRWSNF